MELLEIKKHPDKILRKQCQPIGKITEKEKDLFEKMLFTMKHFCGIGLAAPQIGIAKKMIVAEVNSRIIKLVNPQIVGIRGSDRMVEGCLSVPEVAIDIQRPNEVFVQGLDERGKIVEIRMEGLLARVVQHEIDHLQGKLIIDYRKAK
ncbi:MAG: peptide deformylase [Candidatus Gygaella obscura]|nr:peptide deformylase [Candidatus Gygaella obscura]